MLDEDLADHAQSVGGSGLAALAINEPSYRGTERGLAPRVGSIAGDTSNRTGRHASILLSELERRALPRRRGRRRGRRGRRSARSRGGKPSRNGGRRLASGFRRTRPAGLPERPRAGAPRGISPDLPDAGPRLNLGPS